ncbi:MAG: Methyltransferase domain protein [Candidatus Scalindua rubra]|uniref:Methyltransferase domain protein n=1 Tax=Candidatus Scalindua rubra TaxID=1872076 RepID=A0A1E3X4V2_9BACT|nr:MAG: Methyltransferase domain protein [Candidatus Scalindua rubra]
MQTGKSTLVLLKAVIRISLDYLGLLPYVRQIQKKIDLHLYTIRQNRLTPEQIDAIYAAQYHERANYGRFDDEEDSGWEPDVVIKLAHAKAIIQVLPHIKKVLVGGCSSGMGVFAFRQLDIQAWGFEISPDLDRIVLPEVKAYVRSGSMINIPFDTSDGFDCFVTTDVVEHVQLKSVKRAFQEMARLNCPWMVHLINHTDIKPDHMTLKPLKWWAKQAKPYYRLRTDLQAPESGNPRIYGLNGDPRHVYTFWERV